MGSTNVIGARFDNTTTAQEFGLGVKAQNHVDDQEYVYVKASASIAQYDFVGIDEDWQAAPLTTAMADDGWFIGVAQVAITSGDHGWVAVRGANLRGNVAGSVAADVTLRTSTSAGALEDYTSAQTVVNGVVVVTTNTEHSVTNEEVLLTWPRSNTF